jgi:hypothetical protein
MVKMKMMMEHQWKTEELGEKCHFFHHKSHMG